MAEKAESKKAVAEAGEKRAAAEVADEKKAVAEAGAEKARQAVAEGAVQVRGAMQKHKGVETIMSKGAEGMMKLAEEAAEFGRGNIEAFTKAAQTWALGVQEIARQAMAVTQGLTDHTLEGAKALAAVKSLNEAAEVQAKYAKAAIEKTLTETMKLQEATLRLAEQAMAPIQARMAAAMEKFGKPLAA